MFPSPRRSANAHRADKSVADQRASAERDVRSVQEQLQRCKDGSSTAEKEAAARQKKLADDLSAWKNDLVEAKHAITYFGAHVIYYA